MKRKQQGFIHIGAALIIIYLIYLVVGRK